MIDRRTFTGLMASSVAFSSRAWAQRPDTALSTTMYFASVGPVLTAYQIQRVPRPVWGPDSGPPETRPPGVQWMLLPGPQVTLPANVQYAWQHPSRRYFYVVSSNGQPGGGDAPKGDVHSLNAFTLDTT